VTVAPFGTPSQVSGLVLTPGDSSLAEKWDPAASPGRPIADYQYRLNGGGWVGAGPATTSTINSLANGTDYRVEVRACNAETGYPENVRCGPASAAVTGRPYGGLADPKVDVAPADRWSSTVGATWTFPGGNGRDVTSQTVQITGAVTETPPSSGLTGSWSRDIGYGQSVTVTVKYCVTGTGGQPECRQSAATAATATKFTLATVAQPPLTGTCGVPVQYEGEWRTDINCAPGVWVTAPDSVDLLCVATGAGYPQYPAGSPEPQPYPIVNQWYRGADAIWYRQPAFQNADPGLPPCN
jgi:hypothetical protein